MRIDRLPRIALIILISVIVGVSSGPAQAHRPYFTRSKVVTLPDGRQGEMRIIAGDGIFFADRTRLLVLDDKGRLLGKGPAYGFVDIICSAQSHCYGYDYRYGTIIEADPATFRPENAPLPSMEERDGLWNIEGNKESWGVTVRPASLKEMIFCEASLFLRSPSFLFFLIFGLFFSLCIFSISRPAKRTTWGVAAWGFGVFLRLLGGLLIVLISRYFAALLAPTLLQGVGSFALGSAGAILLISRRSKRACPEAQDDVNP